MVIFDCLFVWVWMEVDVLCKVIELYVCVWFGFDDMCFVGVYLYGVWIVWVV